MTAKGRRRRDQWVGKVAAGTTVLVTRWVDEAGHVTMTAELYGDGGSLSGPVELHPGAG